MTTPKNPTRSINAYKGLCLKRVQEVGDFLDDNPDLNPENVEELKELNTALKNQLERMETAWESIVGNLEDNDTFDTLNQMVNEVSGEVE